MKTSDGGGRPDRPGHGVGMGHGFGGGSFAVFDATAKVLGLTPVELFTELHAGKTVEQVAQAKGVAVEKVQEAVKAARLAEAKVKLAQAVKEGKLTQEQADQAIRDIEAGKRPMGPGPGGPRGPGGPGGPGPFGGPPR